MLPRISKNEAKLPTTARRETVKLSIQMYAARARAHDLRKSGRHNDGDQQRDQPKSGIWGCVPVHVMVHVQGLNILWNG